MSYKDFYQLLNEVSPVLAAVFLILILLATLSLFLMKSRLLIVRGDVATKEDISTLKTHVLRIEDAQEAHAARISSVERDLARKPSSEEVTELSHTILRMEGEVQKIDTNVRGNIVRMEDAMRAMTGHIKGVGNQVQMIHQHLLQNPIGGKND